jgi:radical SAM protein with 4Fe4S-binding SPASM domain
MRPNDYFEAMNRLEELRLKGIRVRKCFDFVNNHLVENENCPVRSGTSIHIAADGSVSPCGFLVQHPECDLGSIRDSSIPELKTRYPLELKKLAPVCYRCEFYQREYCHGGCPARIHAIHHKFDAVDIYCMAKYFQS